MNKLTRTALAASASLLCSTAAFAAVDGATGTVNFMGDVVESACNLDAGNQAQDVDFGQVGKGVLANGGVANAPFSIKLTGCDPSAKIEGLPVDQAAISTVALRFESAAMDPATTTELTNSAADGSAAGVAVKVLSNENNKYLTFDGQTDSKVTQNMKKGDITYNFTATLAKATGASEVTTGKISTATNFVVEYN